MFWFKHRRPLDDYSADWVEQSLLELAFEFGQDVFLQDPKEPTAEFFPGALDGSDGAVERTINRVGGLIGIKRNRYRVVIEKLASDLYLEDGRGNWSPSGAAGLFEDHGYEIIIRIDQQYRTNLAEIIGTSAHEFGHLLLMGEKRINPMRFDNELLTDLTAVYHGFGIFLASSPRAFESMMSFWPGTKVRRPEYMSLPMYGHALAHQAWHRGERKPPWLRFLSSEARACTRASLKWLWKTGQSRFVPDSTGLASQADD